MTQNRIKAVIEVAEKTQQETQVAVDRRKTINLLKSVTFPPSYSVSEWTDMKNAVTGISSKPTNKKNTLASVGPRENTLTPAIPGQPDYHE